MARAFFIKVIQRISQYFHIKKFEIEKYSKKHFFFADYLSGLNSYMLREWSKHFQNLSSYSDGKMNHGDGRTSHGDGRTKNASEWN